MTTDQRKEFEKIIKKANNERVEILLADKKGRSFLKLPFKEQQKIVMLYYKTRKEIAERATQLGVIESELIEISKQLSNAFGDEFALLVLHPDARAYEKVCDIAGIELEYVDGIARIPEAELKKKRVPAPKDSILDGFIVQKAGAYPGIFKDTEFSAQEKREMFEYARACLSEPTVYSDIPTKYFYKGGFIDAITDMIKNDLNANVELIQSIESMKALEKEIDRIGEAISKKNIAVRVHKEEQVRVKKIVEENIASLEDLLGYILGGENKPLCQEPKFGGIDKVDEFCQAEFHDILASDQEHNDVQQLGVAKATVYSVASILSSYISQLKDNLEKDAKEEVLDELYLEEISSQIETISKKAGALVDDAKKYEKQVLKAQEKISSIGGNYFIEENEV